LDIPAKNRTRELLKREAESGAVAEWKPQQAGVRDELVQALKAAASAVRDWEALDQAVDQEISDQQHLVEWWDEHKQSEGRPKKNETGHDHAQFPQPQLEAISELGHEKVGRWRKALRGDLDEYRDLLRGPSWRKAMGERGSSDQKGASGTGENEWFTPAQYIEAARMVMGEIDLDPATSAKAQELIAAHNFYTKQDDGLRQEWHGRVWLNPPYAQPLIAEFISKFCAEWQAERITEAIVLTHNYTDTSWFHELAGPVEAICFTRGRVKFYDGATGKIAAPTQGQAFSYFGANVARFAEVFESIGFVVVPWRGA
jgi:phage N-6-adenine-methyltransferase